ncbi:MAG TPA: SDR family NAD(P)-dependent oxidoreductase [Acidimicrobiia bacterium]|jgi:NAD(P)-dependent dehydrogenase (short-subunit alcohol dehydrogenase family)
MSTERVAIVTGGSCGIGREITRRLTLQGYAVVVAYRMNQAAAEAAVDEVLAANGIALAVRADVTDDVDVDRLFLETVEAFGRVDLVVDAVRQPAGCSLDTLRAMSCAFARVLDRRDVNVDTVEHRAGGAVAAVADEVASLAGRGGRALGGHLIEVRARAGPGTSTGAMAPSRARRSHGTNLRR